MGIDFHAAEATRDVANFGWAGLGEVRLMFVANTQTTPTHIQLIPFGARILLSLVLCSPPSTCLVSTLSKAMIPSTVDRLDKASSYTASKVRMPPRVFLSCLTSLETAEPKTEKAEPRQRR
jgi:hypothetical protein